MRFGDFELFVVSDGTFRLDGGAMFGVVPRVLWEKTNPPDESNRITLGLNGLLVRTPSDTVVIDTGIGTIYDEKFAKIYAIDKSAELLASLHEVGVSPEEVTKVILTHLHFDHCGGNTVKQGEKIVPTFPRATYFVQEGELKAARKPDPRSQGSYLPHTWEPVAEAGQLEILEGNQEVVPGIETFVTGGHTRDHQIIKIRSGGQTACYLADLVPTDSHLKTPYVMAYDLYPKTTMEMKEKVLRQAAAEAWLLFFEHAPKVRAGYVKELEGKPVLEQVDV